MDYPILVKNLKRGFNEFEVEDNYLKHLFTGKIDYMNKNLNVIFDMMRKFTFLTQREMRMQIYTTFNNSPSKKMRIPNLMMAIPVIGDQRSVANPLMTGIETTATLKAKDEIFYLPLIDIHTHPGCAYPSVPDLTLSYRDTTKIYSVKRNSFKVAGGPINVILSPSAAMLYRNTGNYREFQKFMNVYEQKTKDSPSINDFVEDMNSSGAFQAHYVDFHNEYTLRDCVKNIKGEELEKIADLFCPITFKVKKL
jgi:hypothetical protein